MTQSPLTLADLVARAATLEGQTSGVVQLNGELVPWSRVATMVDNLARWMISAGVRRGDRVVIHHPKSLESFISVHAVLRSGGVVVPLDPNGGVSLLGDIVRSTEPVAAVIGGSTTPELFDATTGLTLFSSTPIDDYLAAGFVPRQFVSLDDATGTGSDEALPEVAPDDAAYIIFTSGSTGRPKGIVHTHRSGLAYATEAAKQHGLTAIDRLAGTSPLHFDMSTLELYAVPLVGATAVTIGEAEQRFPVTLTKHLERDRVSVLYTVPFLLRQLQLHGRLLERDLSSIRQIGYGGEPYPPGALAELLGSIPGAVGLNVYGPAEVNGVISYSVTTVPQGADVPIGTAWSGVRYRIVDASDVDVSPGATGELLVSAPTCMDRYWRDPERTARSFLSAEASSERWYRTGDVVAVDPAGLLVFCGRQDYQVKIRGTRIELEATEMVLTDAPGVAHAVAVVHTRADGWVELVAGVALRDGASFDARLIQSWCVSHLPSAAVPGAVIEITNVPITGSGKFDRRAARAALEEERR